MGRGLGAYNYGEGPRGIILGRGIVMGRGPRGIVMGRGLGA